MRGFWILWGILLPAKLWIAATLAPFGDEAFYWQESRHPALAYSDLPPATALLIRGGEVLLGHGELGLRAAFLLLGALLPLLVRHAGTRWFGPRAGAIAGIGWMLLPLGGSLGVLALPDVPLSACAVLALIGFDEALRRDRWRDWLLTGLALGAAWLCHYRAAMLVAAGLALLLFTPRGRTGWRRPGLWLALGLGLLGLWPTLSYNFGHDWSGLRFQLVDRHPWRFHADALVQPLEQALVVTPVLYALLIAALAYAWRRRSRGGPWDLLAISGLTFVLGYFAIGLFADDLRFRVHWPLPGLVPALLVLPVMLDDWLVHARRRAYGLSYGLAGIGLVVTLAYLGLAGGGAAELLHRAKAFPDNFVGWQEASAASARHLAESEPGTLLVADGFMLGAELDFGLAGTRPVYVLDHPYNTKHGRAGQLADWRLDETALRGQPGRPVLLAVEETGIRERERAAWLGSLCRRVAGLVPVERLRLYDGRKVFAFYRGRVPMAGEILPDTCAATP